MNQYDGFANFETYLVASWLRHSDSAIEYWLSIVGQAALNARHDEDVRDGTTDIEAAQLRDVEHQLIEQAWRSFGKGLTELASTLLDAAVRRVDWTQLARFVVNGLQEPPDSASAR